MKKNVSFCLLSMLLVLFGVFSNQLSAQAPPPPCKCFWLENTDPATHPAWANSLKLQQVEDQVDLYRIMIDSCLMNDTAKISLEWEIRDENGVIVTDPIKLANWVQVELLTYYNRIDDHLGRGLYLPKGEPEVINGEIRSYPGAIKVIPGFVNFNAHSLDFFYFKFYNQTEKFMKVNWRQTYEKNYSVTLHLVERTGGDDYITYYYDDEQRYNIGGHSSVRGRILASFEMKPLVVSKDTITAEICFTDPGYTVPGTTITIDKTVDTLVPYINPECPYIDSAVFLKLTKHAFIPEPVVVSKDTTYCKYQIPAVLEANADAGMIIEWRHLDGTWNNTAPVVATDTLGTFDYYVRQATDSGLYCTSDSVIISITVIDAPISHGFLLSKEYCKNDAIDALETLVPAVTDAGYVHKWSIDNGATWSTVAPIIDSSIATTSTVLFCQYDTVTTCTSTPFDTIIVTINPLPEVKIEITSPAVLCAESTITFTADDILDATYTWNGVLGTHVLDSVFSASGDYEIPLQVVSDKGCVYLDTVRCTILPLPVVGPLTLTPVSVCSGVAAMLIAPDTTGTGDVFTYLWTPTNETTRTIEVTKNVTELDTTDYVITVTSANGCSVDVELTLYVYPLPTVTIVATDNTTGDTLDINDVLCIGTVVKLEAIFDPAFTCEWTTGETTAVKYVTLENTTTLVSDSVLGITVSTVGTPVCTIADDVTLKVSPVIDLEIISLAEPCEPLPIELQCGTDPSKFNSWVWTAKNSGPYSSGATIVTNVIDTFTVTALDEYGCLHTADYVGPNPIDLKITMSPNDTVCPGTVVTLDVNPSVPVANFTSIDWNVVGDAAVGTGTSFTYTATSNTTDDIITVLVAVKAVYDDGSSAACDVYDTVSVAVLPQPNVNIAGLANDTVQLGCINNVTFDIIGTVSNFAATAPNYTFDWDVDGVTATNASITGIDTFVYTPAGPGTVDMTLDVENEFGCVANLAYSVTVSDTNMFNLASSHKDTVCPGTTVTIAAISDASVTATWNGGAIASSDTTLTVTAETTITAIPSSGCYAPDSITIYVFTLPAAPDITPTALVCPGDSADITILNYSANFKYTWNTGDTTETIRVPMGTYNVTMVDSNGCVSVVSNDAVVSERIAPDSAFAIVVSSVECWGDTTLCEGTVFGLEANETGSGFTYSFVINGGTPYTTASVSGLVVPDIDLAIVYTITDANGCTNTDEATITAKRLPVVDKGERTFTSCDPLPATIDIYFKATADYDYTWTNTLISTGDTVGFAVTKVLDTAYATITDNGCSIDDTIFIESNYREIVVSAGTNDTVCIGTTATLSVDAVADATYTWESLNGAPALVATANDYEKAVATDTVGEFMYAVMIEVTNKCTAYDTITMWVNQPLTTFTYDTLVCRGDDIVITPVDATLNYTWTATATSAITISSPTASILEISDAEYGMNDTITIHVEYTNSLGCVNTEDFTVVVIGIDPDFATTYSPNDTACASESITIELTPNKAIPLTYDWGLIAGDTNQVTISSPITGADTTIHFTVANASCTPKAFSVDLKFWPMPTAKIDTTDTIACYLVVLTTVIEDPTFNYEWTMVDKNSNPLLSGATTFETNATFDTAFVYTTGVVTLTVTDPVFGCSTTDDQAVHVSPDPLMEITYDGNVVYEISVPADSFFNFQLVIDTFCTDPDTKVDVSYEVYKNNILLPENGLNPLLTTPGTVFYSVDITGTHSSFYLQTYTSDKAQGRIPSAEHATGHQLYVLTTGLQYQRLDWFFLHFVHQRPINMNLALATRDTFEFVYTLNDVTNSSTNEMANAAYAYVSGDALSPGGVALTGTPVITKTLATRSLVVIVTEPTISPISPEPMPTIIPAATAVLAPEVLVYPNPTAPSSEITVKVNGMMGDVQINMYDGLGRVVKMQNANITKSNEELKLQIENVPTGIFFISVKNNDTVVTRKVVIANN